MTGRLREDEILEVDGGTKERSWWIWRWAIGRGAHTRLSGEERPLLGSS